MKLIMIILFIRIILLNLGKELKEEAKLEKIQDLKQEERRIKLMRVFLEMIMKIKKKMKK